MESSVAPSEPLSRVLSIYSTTHRSASGFCPDGMPRAGRSAGASNGQWQGDERRLPEISKVRNAEEGIGQSEGLLTVPRLTQADIKPPGDAAQIAERILGVKRLAEA